MEKSSLFSTEAKTSHILGLDFGAAKIGIAVADSETKLAFALITFANDNQFLPKLESLIKKEKVGTIVIGVPAYINNKKTSCAGEKLGERLRQIFPEIEIVFQNEMFTTKMAEDNLKAKGMKNLKKFDDQEAARIILQSWLDQAKK